MRTPADPVWLAKQLEGFYRMLDALELVQAEDKANGGPTIEQMIACADVRQTIETWIAYYHRELRLLARRGGHGHRVQGHRGPQPQATSASVGACGAPANPLGA